MADQNTPPQEQSEANPHFLKELSVKLSENTRIRIITFFAIVTTAMTITWTIAEKYHDHTKLELADATEQVVDIQVETQKLQRQYTDLKADHRELRKSELVPSLSFPVDRQPIIGRHVTFRWDYDSKSAYQNLVLELVRSDPKGGLEENRYQVPETEREEMFFEFPGDERGTGTFFWRIGTGELINNEERTRLWTRYGRFSVYESVIDRIKERKELIVGTSSTFLSYDHPIDENGRPQTFDMDFIDWIAMKLEIEFEFPEHTITVRREPTKWGDELFNSVVNGDVDVAIANITRSVARERKYPGLRFTEGYLNNHQAMVYYKDSGFINGPVNTLKRLRELIRGQKVGVQKDTINYDVAKILAKELGFEVEGKYTSYVDVVDAVRKQKVRFALIDSERLATRNYPDLETVGAKVDLVQYLKEYYRMKLGDAEGEKYAIAVGDDELLEKLNRIISAEENQVEIQRIRDSHYKN